MPETATETTSVYHPQLYAKVERLEYDFATRHGRLYLPPVTSCDMAGCVRMFVDIDPRVREIAVFSGERPDAMYVRDGIGDWLTKAPAADDEETTA